MRIPLKRSLSYRTKAPFAPVRTLCACLNLRDGRMHSVEPFLMEVKLDARFGSNHRPLQ
jgi:hypothetical protein